MMDPAWGPPKAQRALGETLPKRSRQFLASPNMRVDNNGMFSGPRPSYGRYQVSQAAMDAVVRGKRINQ